MKAIVVPLILLVILGSIVGVTGLIWFLGNYALSNITKPTTSSGSNDFKVVFKTYVTTFGEIDVAILGIQLPELPSIKPLSLLEKYGKPVTVRIEWKLFKYDPGEDKFKYVTGSYKIVNTTVGKIEEISLHIDILEKGVYQLYVCAEVEGETLAIDTYSETFKVV